MWPTSASRQENELYDKQLNLPLREFDLGTGLVVIPMLDYHGYIRDPGTVVHIERMKTLPLLISVRKKPPATTTYIDVELRPSHPDHMGRNLTRCYLHRYYKPWDAFTIPRCHVLVSPPQETIYGTPHIQYATDPRPHLMVDFYNRMTLPVQLTCSPSCLMFTEDPKLAISVQLKTWDEQDQSFHIWARRLVPVQILPSLYASTKQLTNIMNWPRSTPILETASSQDRGQSSERTAPTSLTDLPEGPAEGQVRMAESVVRT